MTQFIQRKPEILAKTGPRHSTLYTFIKLRLALPSVASSARAKECLSWEINKPLPARLAEERLDRIKRQIKALSQQRQTKFKSEPRKLSFNTPSYAIPPLGTQARLLLELLTDGKPHTSRELAAALGVDPRSALQSLTGPRYGNWLIHNIGHKRGIYQLDQHHLSGCNELDKDARTIARKRLAERSKSQCQRETRRLPKALKQYSLALEQYQLRFNFDGEDKQVQGKDYSTQDQQLK